MKCSIMLHFIWVFTVCKNTQFGVSEYKRLKAKSRITCKFPFPRDSRCDNDVPDLANVEHLLSRNNIRKYCLRQLSFTAVLANLQVVRHV